MSLVKRQKTDNGYHKALAHSRLIGSTNAGEILYNEAVVLEGHQGSVLSSSFSHNGDNIASGGLDRTILLWKLPRSEEEETPNYGVIKGHKSAVTSVRWLYDDITLVSASADTTIGFWDSETGKRTKKCVGHELAVNEISVSKDSLALSASDDGSACLWDQRQKEATNKVTTEYPLLSCTFNNRGNTFYIGGIDPKIQAYDMRVMDKPVWTCEGQVDSITSIAINKDDSILLSRSLNGALRTYSAREFVPEGIPRMNPYIYDGAPSGNEYQLIRACFSTDNVSIASGSEDKTVTIWDYKSRKILSKISGHRGATLDIVYHPTERILASTSTDGSIIVREI
ncbi:uncharacterized protein AC631_01707 [Debaryomyces fabryi]|uniref:Uncharacterized protein n=1 Tax=Debaryomyces fabryi TaxID=58627 RepID=A0A0V1Q1Y0_9ASCO|nr:uncharacterized protein AC631_01707 [Debaryomyces fabryi]KSA02532.1 hypothetical protein AC631_01707 [Debaryomyces fabryi]CUM47732.1 unnamed protein product [Debaryomyces fabryi]